MVSTRIRPAVQGAAALLCLLAVSLQPISAQRPQGPLPKVHFVATGGTISNKDGGRLTAEELAKSMPGVERFARLTHEQFTNVASSELTLDQWIGLSKRVNEVFASDKELAGIVSGRTEQVRQAIVSKDYGRLPPLVVRTNPGGALSVEKCPKCSAAPVVVKIEAITVDDKGKESRSTVFEEMISAAEAKAMEGALTSPSAPGPAAT